MNLYGVENFTFDIIDKVNSQEDVNEAEEFWIEYFQTLNPEIGYNIRPGGHFTKLSDKTKKKMSIIKLKYFENHVSPRKINLTKEQLENALDMVKNVSTNEEKYEAVGKILGISGYTVWERIHEFNLFKPVKRTYTEKDKENISQRMMGNTHSLGFQHSEETKAQMSRSHKGKNTWTAGVKRTTEYCENQSKIMKGKNTWSKNCPWDIEAKLVLRKFTPEQEIEIYDNFKNAMSYQQLSLKYGSSTQNIKKIINRYEENIQVLKLRKEHTEFIHNSHTLINNVLQIKRPDLLNKIQKQIIVSYNHGISRIIIAKVLGINKKDVNALCRKYNIPTHSELKK